MRWIARQTRVHQTRGLRTVTRSYDARNRLQTLSFPDGNGNQSWTYTADGLPSTVTTSNSGNSVTNTYAYNKRRLLTGEAMTADALQGWSIGYTYNALAQVISEAAPASVAGENRGQSRLS